MCTKTCNKVNYCIHLKIIIHLLRVLKNIASEKQLKKKEWKIKEKSNKVDPFQMVKILSIKIIFWFIIW